MKPKGIACVARLAIGGMLMVATVRADVIYTYTSRSLEAGGPRASEFSHPFSINLTFSDEGCLTEWTASQTGTGTFSSADPLPENNAYRPILYLVTSETGQPTRWFFNALTEHPGTIYWKTQIASINQINYIGESLPGYFYDSAGFNVPPPDTQNSSHGFSYSVGTWTSTGVLPNLAIRFDAAYDTLGVCTVIPEPASYMIMLSGLGLVFLVRKGRRNF